MNTRAINDIKQVDHYYYDEDNILRREECVVLKVTDFDELCQLIENSDKVFDKIRAEIIWYRDNRLSDEANSETIKLTNYYLDIIGKYRTESEVIRNAEYKSQEPETVTEFADRCRECGAKYGKLLKQAQKTGYWIDKDGQSSAVCSCCNKNNVLYGDFCKWCGAKMESKEGE